MFSIMILLRRLWVLERERMLCFLLQFEIISLFQKPKDKN